MSPKSPRNDGQGGRPGAIRGVLLGLDGSPLSEAALPHAEAMARAFDTELFLLRVLESKGRRDEPVDSVAWRLSRAEAKKYLATHVERLASCGLAVRGDVREGDAASEIVDFARRHDIGLLVIGSHGEGGATPFALSGTVQKVITRAGRSVLLVRCLDGERRAKPEAPLYRRIVVPVDGSQRSEWAVCLAATVARSESAEVVLVAVAPVAETVRRPPLDPRSQRLVDELASLNRRWAEQHLEEMRQRLASSSLEVRTVVSSSRRVRHELDEQLRALTPDLVVVSAHGAAGGARWPFGSTTSHLVHNGTAPLLVLQDQRCGALEPEETELASDDSRSPRHRS